MTTTQGNTLTNTEWLQAIKRVDALQLLSPVSKEAYNKILDLVNNEGYPLDDIRDFINTYGTEAFVDGHYETWAKSFAWCASNEAIEAFVEEFGIDSIGGFEDSYQGSYNNGAEFAQELVEGGWEIDNIPDFVEIDWEATWENLSDDYTKVDGHIFRNTW